MDICDNIWSMANRYQMFIGGKWVDGKSYMEVRSPYDNSLVGEVPQAAPEELSEAIEAAKKAFPVISGMPAHRRSEILEKTSCLLYTQMEEFARTISEESGKPIKESRSEVTRSVQTFKFAAEEAKRIYGETIPMDAAIGGEGRVAYVERVPLGVIACITPFNFPLNLVAHKVGPAIAAGNSLVLKPASATPITSLKLARVLEEAGIPPGVVNVITGSGATIGDLLVTDERIAMVTFTGSVEVGKRIKQLAGMKRVTLELGSNSAVIVDEDGDVNQAVPRIIAGGFGNSGQTCISVQRVYVHKNIIKDFLSKLIPAVEKLKLGHPLSDDTDISSMISHKDAVRVMDWIEEAKRGGAKVLTGGEAKGNTVKPTVLTSVKPDMKVSCMELFGPAIVVGEYNTIDEAISLVNNSRYGLQAGIYTKDLNKAFYAARRLEVGGVMVNEVPTYRADHMPYGGVKDSGTGREGLRYAVEEMTERKLVCIKLG